MNLRSQHLANMGARLAGVAPDYSRCRPVGQHARESLPPSPSPGDSRAAPDALRFASGENSPGREKSQGGRPILSGSPSCDKFELKLSDSVQAILHLAAKAAGVSHGEFVARAICAYAAEAVGFPAMCDEHAAELAAPMDGETSEYERLFNEKMATPSEVFALSRHLEVFVAARAKQGVRLQTGERVVEFSEEHQNAKGESIVVPGIFMVSVPAFVDGDAVRIPARLRYRVSGGKVVWFYQLYRWESFLREQVGHDLRDASDRTELPAFEGAPEA